MDREGDRLEILYSSIYSIGHEVIQMSQDFFEATQNILPNLNQTDRDLFEYVVKNMDHVKDLSIQKFAAERFLSTTTIFRFTQKLGFSGYTDFINSLLVTAHQTKDVGIPQALHNKIYSEMYLKNIIEAVRVMPVELVARVMDVLETMPKIFLFTDEHASLIGQYSEKLFLGLGFTTYFPEAAYQMPNLLDTIKSNDMIIALSYSGQDQNLINIIKKVYVSQKPFLLSITRADNNVLEGLSDVNFYVFAEEIHINGMNLTSTVPMLTVLELLVYEYIAHSNDPK